jgi:hypothetical protein
MRLGICGFLFYATSGKLFVSVATVPTCQIELVPVLQHGLLELVVVVVSRGLVQGVVVVAIWGSCKRSGCL